MRLSHGSIEKLPSGHLRASVYVAGKRIRATFDSTAQAKEWVRAQTEARAHHLNAAQLIEAAEAYALLPPDITLIEAVKLGLKNAPRPTSQTSVTALANTYISERARELRPRTISGYRQHLNQALPALGDTLTTHTKEAIRAYVSGMTPDTKNRHLRALSAFYGWCVEAGHLHDNPAAGIKLAKVAEPSKAILSLANTQALLRHALKHEPRTFHYFAIGLFAGLRPEEILRLPRHAIGQAYITLTANETKTTSARTVAIRPNLRAILDRHPIPESGILHGLSHDRFRKVLGATIKGSGIAWAQDILRHSFASYGYEKSKDAAATAYEMGHKGTDVFFRHYRGLVAPGDGQKYFSITI